ncbi:MAG: ATP-binding protein [bacterium]|nr:ATP-binding protein [bacterium]
MDEKLLAQLKTWNPWWTQGPQGIERFRDPDYKRELYHSVARQLRETNQMVSIVGMRQVGKSTLMRQLIKEYLKDGVSPQHILYMSFDDPFLKIHYDAKTIFDAVMAVYAEVILKKEIEAQEETLYLFLDEIHQLPDWEKTLKSYYDRSFPVKYVVSGSSSLHLQTKNKETLVGRIAEFTLWPFSFREFVELKAQEPETKDERLADTIPRLRATHSAFLKNLDFGVLHQNGEKLFRDLSVWHKTQITNFLQQFILAGGFPRAWQQPDFISRQKFLWEQQVGKIVFEDLVQIANLRKPKDLEFLFARIVDFNGREVSLRELKGDLRMHRDTLDRYLSYLIRTFLIFRVERTKAKRIARKRRAGNAKFYLSDVALRNAFYKKSEDVFYDPEEMGIIAENLVCSVLERWVADSRREEQLAFYKDRSGEIDFVVKTPGAVLPVEVKWRDTIPPLKTLDKVCKEWDVRQSMVVTKDGELRYENGRLFIPLWFFLLAV